VALYIPAGRRRRRIVIAAVVAAVVGLALGWTLGRATAPTVSDRVSSVRSDAQALDGRMQALPGEYEKILAGDRQFASGGGPADTLVVIRTDAARVAGAAEWLTATQRGALDDAIARALQVATAKGSADDFATAIDDAVAAVDETFGVGT
jgi:hypothetical protein